MTQTGENEPIVCDLCGTEFGLDWIQRVDVMYCPNDKLQAKFELYLCRDCLVDWINEDL